MRIMPILGNNIGFNSKGWRKLAALSLKAQDNPQENERYFDSLTSLPVKSTKASKVEIGDQTETVRSPGSPWGGKEIVLGREYSATVEMVLEGSVVVPPAYSDEDAKKRIEQDFSDFAWGENNACFEAVNDLKRQMGDGEKDEEVSAIVLAFSRGQDGTAMVTINFTATITSEESIHDAKAREDDERGEYLGDQMRDEGL